MTDMQEYRKIPDKAAELVEFCKKIRCISTQELEEILVQLQECVFSSGKSGLLLDAIECLLKILKEADEEDECREYILKNIGYYYDFLDSASQYIRFYSTEERTAKQERGIQWEEYAALQRQIVQVLNTGSSESSECNYVFMIIPKMQYCIDITEIFPNASKRNRLMIMKIPQRVEVTGCDMINVLAHETAHYVGRAFRMRCERMLPFLKSVSHTFVRYIFCLYKTNTGIDFNTTYEVSAEKIEKRMTDRIIQGLEVKCAELNQKKLLKDKIYHFAILASVLKNVMDNIVEGELELVFAPAVEECECVEDARNMMLFVREIAERFMEIQENDTTTVNYRTVTGLLVLYYEECFADIMSVLILGLKPQEYIETFENEMKQQNADPCCLLDADVMFRIGTVILCIGDMEDGMTEWRKEFCGKAVTPEVQVELWRKIGSEAVLTCYTEDVPADRYEENVYAAVADNKVFRELYGYLMLCIRRFMELQDESNLNEIRDSYERAKREK